MSSPEQDTVIVRSSDGSLQTINFQRLQIRSNPTLTLLYSKYCLEQKRWIIICVDKLAMTYHRFIFEDDTYKPSQHCSCANCKLIPYRNALGLRAHNREHQWNLLDAETNPLIIIDCQRQEGNPDKLMAMNWNGEINDYTWKNGSYQKGEARVIKNLDLMAITSQETSRGPLQLIPKSIETCAHLNDTIYYANTPESLAIQQYVFNTVELGFERIRCEPCERMKRSWNLPPLHWIIDTSRDGQNYEIKVDKKGFLAWELGKDVEEEKAQAPQHRPTQQKASAATVPAALPSPAVDGSVYDSVIRSMLSQYVAKETLQKNSERIAKQQEYYEKYSKSWLFRDVEERPRHQLNNAQKHFLEMLNAPISQKPKKAPEPIFLNPANPYYYGHSKAYDETLAEFAQLAQEQQAKTDKAAQKLMNKLKQEQDELNQLRLLEAEAKGIGASLFSGLGAPPQHSKAPPDAYEALVRRAQAKVDARVERMTQQAIAAAAVAVAAQDCKTKEELEIYLREGPAMEEFRDLYNNQKTYHFSDLNIKPAPPEFEAEFSQASLEQYMSHIPPYKLSKPQIHQFLAKAGAAPEAQPPAASPSDSESSLEHVNWRDTLDDDDGEESETGYESPV